MPPAQLWMHDGISEREVAHYWPGGRYDNAAWEDCTWDSALMWYRATYDPSKPSTHYEAERLRQASGEDTWSGSNPLDIRRGILNRYGKTIPLAVTGWSRIKLMLGVGYNGVVSGSMDAFPYGHRLRRGSPSFSGNHAVHAAKVDNVARYWVTDPLFPEDHDGEWWAEDELRRFVQAGFNLYSLIGKTLPKPAATPIPPKPPAQRVRVVAGGSFWDYTIHGTRSSGYEISRVSKITGDGFSATLGASRIDTKGNPAFPSGTWGGRRRTWAKIISGVYNGIWIDLREGPNVTVF